MVRRRRGGSRRRAKDAFMSAPNSKTPTMRPYLPATADFAGGKRFARAGFWSAASPILRPGSRGSAPSSRSTSRAHARRRMRRRRAGAPDEPLSPIDGMPVGVKDIIETIDMPTAERLAAVRRLPQRARRRERRRAARGRRRHRRQDGDDRVRRDRAARHPQSVGSGAHARRLQQRLRRGGRAGRDRGRARHPGDRLDPAAGELLRLLRLQADGRRDQPRRQL